MKDRALIFGMHDPCDKPFQVTPSRDLDLELWPSSRSKLLPSGGPQFSEFACFYRFLCSKMRYLHLFFNNFHVYKYIVEEGLYKRFKWLKIFNEFFMYLFSRRKGGGALMQVYELEHIVSLSYRTAWWMFTKFGTDEVLMVPHMTLCLCFSANSA